MLVLLECPSSSCGIASRLSLTKGILVLFIGPSAKDCVENATTADSACNDSGCSVEAGSAAAE